VDSVQRTASISSGRDLCLGRAAVQEVNFRGLVGFLPFRLSRLCSLRVSIGFDALYYSFSSSHAEHVSCRGILLRRKFCGAPQFVTQFFLTCSQLLDVLNAHFQQVFGINKLQSTMLQLAYFVGTRDFI
jgi:fucose permease